MNNSNDRVIGDHTLSQILEYENLNITKNPRGTDKGDKKSYIQKFYEPTFATYRDKPIQLFEIGFRHGASLALWSSYFINGKIFGADNYSDSAIGEKLPIVEEWINRPNIHTILGDAYDKEFADCLKETFDIIIDDGPHTLDSQKKALQLYLVKLKANGVFVIEDILIGGLAIFPLLMNVPKQFDAYFYDFRWHKRCGDNCLFVVKPCDGKSVVFNRLKLITWGIVARAGRRFTTLCKKNI